MTMTMIYMSIHKLHILRFKFNIFFLYFYSKMIGCHFRIAMGEKSNDSIVNVINYVKETIKNKYDFELESAQVFVSSPRSLDHISDKCIADFSKFFTENETKGITHGSYCCAPWDGSKPRSQFIKKFIRTETERLKRAGFSGMIIHYPSSPITVEETIKAMTEIYNPNGVKIYLETPSSNPERALLNSPEKINELFEKIPDNIRNGFGLCIDTAHMFSSGCKISSYEDARILLDGIDLSPDDVMIHLNDNLNSFGTGSDIHAPLTYGKIWEDYKGDFRKSGLFAFLEYIYEHNTITILERSSLQEVEVDIQVIKSLT
jgi:endonuclease IV